MKKTKYFFSSGKIKRVDNSVVFENEYKKIKLPIEGLKELHFYSSIEFNDSFLSLMAKHNVDIFVYDFYGNQIGAFYNQKKMKNAKILIKQVEFFQRNRLYIAKEIVRGLNKSIERILLNYYKNKKRELKKNLSLLKQQYAEIDDIKEINELMLLEGRIWKNLYDNIPYLINDKLTFKGRTKRPPLDEINALISFLNTVLYNKTFSKIQSTSIYPEVSFLHEPLDRKNSLALDIAEVFKVDFSYRIIFKLVNKKMLKEEHFRSVGSAIFLNEEGKRLVLKEVNKKLNETKFDAHLKREISFEHRIKLEVYKIVKTICEGEPYIFYGNEISHSE